MLDCLVIGGGPAGFLAAVYLGRYLRSVQVIDAGESRAAKIPESHNYPGFFGIAGPALLRRLNAQARQYGAELVSGRVTSLRKEGDTFVASSSGSGVNARFILLATGLVDQCRTIEGQPADCPRKQLRLNPEVISSDAGEFALALKHGDFERAASLYEGPFLEGFHLSVAHEFESWVADADSSMYSVLTGTSCSSTNSLTETMVFSRRSTACW